MHEMRDISPDRTIIIACLDRWPQRGALRFHPDVRDFIAGQLGIPAGIVKACLEIVEGDLPDNSVQHILNLASKKPLPDRRIIRAVNQPAKGQHLGKDRSGFSQCQRCVGHQISAISSKALVNAVAHLVRQRHHITRLAGKIHQNIGMR